VRPRAPILTKPIISFKTLQLTKASIRNIYALYNHSFIPYRLEDQKIVVGTKLSKLEMRIKQLREAEKSKQAKLLARNLVEELLSIHEVMHRNNFF